MSEYLIYPGYGLRRRIIEGVEDACAQQSDQHVQQSDQQPPKCIAEPPNYKDKLLPLYRFTPVILPLEQCEVRGCKTELLIVPNVNVFYIEKYLISDESIAVDRDYIYVTLFGVNALGRTQLETAFFKITWDGTVAESKRRTFDIPVIYPMTVSGSSVLAGKQYVAVSTRFGPALFVNGDFSGYLKSPPDCPIAIVPPFSPRIGVDDSGKIYAHFICGRGTGYRYVVYDSVSSIRCSHRIDLHGCSLHYSALDPWARRYFMAFLGENCGELYVLKEDCSFAEHYIIGPSNFTECIKAYQYYDENEKIAYILYSILGPLTSDAQVAVSTPHYITVLDKTLYGVLVHVYKPTRYASIVRTMAEIYKTIIPEQHNIFPVGLYGIIDSPLEVCLYWFDGLQRFDFNPVKSEVKVDGKCIYFAGAVDAPEYAGKLLSYYTPWKDMYILKICCS